MTKLLKTPNIVILGTIIAVVGVGIAGFSRNKGSEKLDFAVVKRGDVIQEVEVTGEVKAAQDLNLALERGGKVAGVFVKVGDQVMIGQRLLVLSNTDVWAGVLQAQANLDAEKAKLAELKRGTRPEELQVAEIKVANAENVLGDVEANLENAKNKAGADLQNSLDALLTALQKAVTVAKNSLLVLTDLQFAHFSAQDQEGIRVLEAKALAIEALFAQINGGYLNSSSISILGGGIFGQVLRAGGVGSAQNTEELVLPTLNALQSIRSAFDTVSVKIQFTSTEKTNLATEKNNVNTEITSISAKREALAVQKAVNANNINAAQITLTNARNTLLSAQGDLRLKRTGSAPEEIDLQEAKMRGALANLKNAQANFDKTIVNSPISGIVTKQEAKIGEIVSANAPLVSLVSDAGFIIEANVPETDIVKVKTGDMAKVTLDAYSNDVVFDAKVTIIDLAGTLVEGVPTYKATLEFLHPDARFRSGMTANLLIQTDKRGGVIFLPERAILEKNGKKIVELLSGEKIGERVIETGLGGTDGNVEIISGLNENDKVVIPRE